MSIKEEIKGWQEENFVKTLADMGIKEGSIVVDFGCGVGNYAFSVSYRVGGKGKVYAIDKSRIALEYLSAEAEQKGIQNVIPMTPEYDGRIPLKDCSADMVMIYDLIHDLGGQKRQILNECRRILKVNGTLSVAPFHMEEWQIAELMKEIEGYGFALGNVQEKKALHFEMYRYLFQETEPLDEYEKCNIYNFIKKKKSARA